MTERDPQLLLQAAPFLRRGVTTPRLMVEVTIGLAPVVGAAIWFFGVSAILVLVAATAGAVVTEWLFGPGRPRGATLGDGSAVLTGILLGLCLPPGIALWMAFLGGAVAIGLGKIVFGGLGQNLFNPALVGRAFLQAAFPTAITTWTQQGTLGEFLSVRGSTFAPPFMQAADVDAVSAATPLGLMKFEGVPTEIQPLVLGNTAGSLGETCAIVIVICGLFLAWRRLFDWRIPVAILGTVAVLSTIVWLVDRDGAPSPAFMLFSGGLLFGSVYMATDPVTSPISARGAWVFGAGVGALVVLIRLWGGQPEGVMYAILLMNATTPLIDRITQPRGFGRGSAAT
ncbi:MAG: RnfABCDGE type electron transport complex subunit D [Planctomycetota bacterium]|jgi:electron transport complex protein RnfD